MSTQSAPNTFLISGTSRGIGKHLAEHYASKGHRVYGCSRSPIDWQHDRYTHFVLDVSDEDAVKTLLTKIRKDSGRLDVLINNAAINPAIAPAMLTPAVTVMKTLETNFLGTFLLSREAAKIMVQNRFGRIINMSSMAAYHHVAGEAAYTASKAAVTAFSRVFAKEVAGHGITCNILAPAAIPTELSAAVNAKALQQVLSRNAIPEMGDLADVSNAIDWLIRPESHAVTGQVIYLGGV
jgi:3-oxoacyl-[acyl-carrier protein] reductase